MPLIYGGSMADVMGVDDGMSTIILHHILKNDSFANKLVPYLEKEYFINPTEQAIAEELKNYYIKYNNIATWDQLGTMLTRRSDVNTLDRNVISNVLADHPVADDDWLINETERYIVRQRVGNVFSSTFMDFKNGENMDTYSDRFNEACAFSLSVDLGMCYVRDRSQRWEMYRAKGKKFPFALKWLNVITGGGAENGTLTAYVGGTGSGKTIDLCNEACFQAKRGKKVLYFTMEMAPIKLAQRIDANIMNMDVNEITHLSEEEYNRVLDENVELMVRNGGEIAFKQFPTGVPTAMDFHRVMCDYRDKQGITFDAVYFDYINICNTKQRFNGSDTYGRVKSIAEEMRALAVIWDIPFFTSTQVNKAGQGATDLGFSDVSESHGLSATLDLLIGLIVTDELVREGKMIMCQIKNRFGDVTRRKRAYIGLDRSRMKMFDLDDDGIPDEELTTLGGGKRKVQDIQAVDNSIDLSSLFSNTNKNEEQ